MSNVFEIDFRKKNKIPKTRGMGEKLYTIDVYADYEEGDQVYRYSLNGEPLVVMSPELLLDSLSHLIPDIIGYCTDPELVAQCEETMFAQIYELRESRRDED